MKYIERESWRRCFWATAFILLFAALVGSPRESPQFPTAQPPSAALLTQIYGSCPKGVILEGVADGIEKCTNVQYLIDQNRFILNKGTADEVSYFSPISRDALYQLAMALARDDRLGVSLGVTGKEIVYGAINAKSQVVRTLFAADKFLTAVALGDRSGFSGQQKNPLPFAPRETANRRFPAVVVHKFFTYRFAKHNAQYYLASVKMANVLFPVGQTAADGGFIVGGDAQKIEVSDRENVRDLQAHSAEFLEIPVVKNAAAIGEAAAFLRSLRDNSQIDLVALSRYIMRR